MGEEKLGKKTKLEIKTFTLNIFDFYVSLLIY